MVACVAALAAGALCGCTSSSAPKKRAAPTASMTTTSPAAPSTSSTPRPTPRATPTRLSAFEADPAVQAMRKFQYELGRTINAGQYTSAALRGYSTPYVAKNLKLVVGSDLGSYYPGPGPFQPTGVTVDDASHRTIRGCLVSTGWAEDRRTHKPLKPLTVTPSDFSMVKSSGRWVVNGIPVDEHVSCANVKVMMPKW